MLVSVIIPARQWDPQLEATLGTLAAQNLPSGVELETVVGLAGKAPPVLPAGVRVVHNPSGTIPDALNLAIAAGAGEIVVRIDSRCHVQSDHVLRVIRRLEDQEVGCVGGAQLVLDRGLFGSAYAVAFNSVLLGPSRYRYSRSSGPVDTAYLGAWRRRDLEDLGGFDPRLIRNQDNELAGRVRASGRVVWYDAGLVVGYRNGRGLRASMAHHHEFGTWRMLQAADGQEGLHPRHLVALSAGAVGALLGVAGLFNPTTRGPMLRTALGAYAATVAASAWSASRLRHRRNDLALAGLNPVGVALAPVVAGAINAAWAAGVVRGFFGGRLRSNHGAAPSLAVPKVR